MEKTVDPNALLLQVMGHDLLAPLTALKWQTELLGREDLAPDKRETYRQQMMDSTKLGITLTKHSSVAGQVLVGSYVDMPDSVSLPQLITQAVRDLELQYQRHGLSLALDVAHEERSRELDPSLAALLIWAIAKYFLTTTPAESTVMFQGVVETDETYLLAVSAPNIPERAAYADVLNALSARDAYDQTYVFAKLIQTVASRTGATVAGAAEGNDLVVRVRFTSAAA